jgi:hypothetical protein
MPWNALMMPNTVPNKPDERSGATDRRQTADAALQLSIGDGSGAFQCPFGSFNGFALVFSLLVW